MVDMDIKSDMTNLDVLVTVNTNKKLSKGKKTHLQFVIPPDRTSVAKSLSILTEMKMHQK